MAAAASNSYGSQGDDASGSAESPAGTHALPAAAATAAATTTKENSGSHVAGMTGAEGLITVPPPAPHWATCASGGRGIGIYNHTVKKVAAASDEDSDVEHASHDGMYSRQVQPFVFACDACSSGSCAIYLNAVLCT